MAISTPDLQSSKKIDLVTSIWIVPIITLFISLWLAYQHYAQLGIKIEIDFPTSGGLKIGQSQIKYRNVPIGVVTKILLKEKGDGVTVIARMDNNSRKYLNKKTKFWIVKPEVGSAGITGLDTIITGTYITIFTQKDDSLKKDFIGLEESYVTKEDGTYFTLFSEKTLNIKVSSPIYYRNMEVGSVEKILVNDDGIGIELKIFINKKYERFVNQSSKFWVKSLVDINFINSGLSMDIAPLSHIIKGGLEFSTIFNKDSVDANESYNFILYKDSLLALDKKIGKGGEYIKKFDIFFEDEISNLSVGSIVKFNGYSVGEVTNIKFNYDSTNLNINSEVKIDIDTSAFFDKNRPLKNGFYNLESAVVKGLRARISEENPITKALFINLEFINNIPTLPIINTPKYLIFPSFKMENNEIISSVTNILNMIENLPLENLLLSANKLIVDTNEPFTNLIKELSQTNKAIKTLLKNKETQNITKELNITLKKLSELLISTKKITDGDSQKSIIAGQISMMLHEITKASSSMSNFLNKIDKKPNSLIFGD